MKKGEFNNLKGLLSPNSIAIIGASRDEKKIGNIVIRNIEKSGYAGDIFLINPKHPRIHKYPVYSSVSEIPKIPDLAIIATPAKTVPGILSEIGERGIKNVIIFSAGFKETGEEGKELEKQVFELSIKYDLNILGPNCLGFVNQTKNLNATFGSAPKSKGNLRILSQSGAIATSIFDWALETGIGFSEFITTGNKTVLNENDFIENWLAQKNIRKSKKEAACEPVGIYMESVSEGGRLLKNLQALSKNDPVIILKPGKSFAAKNAMMSHTGAIAGDNAVFEAFVEQSGAVRAKTLEDFFELLMAFSWENAPKGPNVAVISNAGGPAVIASDYIENSGLRVAELSKKCQNKLHKILPKESAFKDPIDVLGDSGSDRYDSALSIVLKEKNVDAVLVILTPQMMTEVESTAKIIAKNSAQFGKTIVCAFMGGIQTSEGMKILQKNKIPVFRFPERAVYVLQKMYAWRNFVLKKQSKISHQNKISDSSKNRIDNYLKIIKSERNILSGYEVNEIFNEAGRTLPPYNLINSFNDAAEFAHRYGFPVSLKITSGTVVHKSDIGGVFAHVKDLDELSGAYKKLKKLSEKLNHDGKHTGIMAQKFAPNGVELIVGIKKDIDFGNVLIIGCGGVYAELFKDQKVILLPASREEIANQLISTNVGKILAGYRGHAAYASDKLFSLIEILEELMIKCELIKEVEINPVIVTSEDIYPIDGKAFI